MNSFDEIGEAVMPTTIGRKRRRSLDKSDRSRSKEGRHSALGKIPSVTWEHSISNICVAATLQADELDNLFHKLYSTTDNVKQDANLLS